MSGEFEFVTAVRDLVKALEGLGPEIQPAEAKLLADLTASLAYYDRRTAMRQTPLCKPPEQSPS